MADTKTRTLFFFLPLLVLACTLTAKVTPLPQERRGELVTTVKPTEQIQTASLTPALRVCQVKTNIDAGTLNLRACGAMTCPVVIVLHEGETLTQTQPLSVDGWLAAQTSAGRRGWVNSNYLDCEVTNE